MAIKQGIIVTVYPDEEYWYSVEIEDEVFIGYHQEGEMLTQFNFGSIDEMEGVATAMLHAVKAARAIRSV